MNFPERPKGSSSDIGKEHFISLKAGQEFMGVFGRGDTLMFEQHWVGGRSQRCTDSACEYCKNDDRNISKRTFRFQTNVIVFNTDAKKWEAKVFEQGGGTYDTLTDLEKAGHKLPMTVMKVSRQGTGKDDTRYSIVPIPGPKAVVTPELDKTLSAIQVHSLGSGAMAAGPAMSTSATETHDDIPF